MEKKLKNCKNWRKSSKIVKKWRKSPKIVKKNGEKAQNL